MDTSALRPRRGYDERIGRTFQTVVIQPTSLCPGDCDYCYLPTRRQRRELLPLVAQAVARSIAEQDRRHDIDQPVSVVWHGGEPTALAISEFGRRLDAFEDLRHAGKVKHSIQTGAFLLNDDWCELLRRYRFSIGVSIDGPRAANVNRVDWAGKPLFDRAIRGIRLLQAHRLEFSVICVVSPETIHDPDALMAFFADLGCTHVGFNIEEFEGTNTRTPVTHDAAQAFWEGVLAARSRHPHLRVRETDQLAAYLAQARTGRKEEWSTARHDPIPTVAWNGDTVLMSPELLGIKDDDHHDFVIANVLSTSLPSMLRTADQAPYINDVLAGLDACEDTCDYWAFCRGGHAANKYFETGTFTATTTAHCRNSRQALVNALAATIKE
ncbi:cyclophane-forming radical SAM peptide maturase AmcB [Actinomadura rupiterrae]|uniref:cyclophane-forming radical SAM peptide maturase AmcB n=1 Tax=Actinomadura rupiterrae TaxID=559627 RepID=UPI0020A5E75A|nr:cyclophane-forming radical SAM peptide maturase AmcB [Actinomadura rupiterrae]MCP2336441.1 uncharacterized protein [Actinomadura rupiterrae]